MSFESSLEQSPFFLVPTIFLYIKETYNGNLWWNEQLNVLEVGKMNKGDFREEI